MPDPGIALAAISAGGSIAGAVGKGKSPQQVSEQKSGFESLPKEIQEYMLGDIFPRIKTQSEKPYVGMPKRAIDASDTDPIFGSKRRVAYDQGIRDELRSNAMFNRGTATTGTAFDQLPTVIQGLGSGQLAFKPGEGGIDDPSRYSQGTSFGEDTYGIPNVGIGNPFFDQFNQSGGVAFDPNRGMFVIQGKDGMIGVDPSSGALTNLDTGSSIAGNARDISLVRNLMA